MAKRRDKNTPRSKSRSWADPEANNSDNPFAALSGLRDQLPSMPNPSPDPPSAQGAQVGKPETAATQNPPKTIDPWLRRRLILRRERKGHGGKTVTRLEGTGLDGEALKSLAKRGKRAMGCGARVEGDGITFQGAIGDRLAKWLEAQGATRIVRAN